VAAVEFDAVSARSDLPYQATRMLLADYANKPADDRLFERPRATGKARPGTVLEAVAAYPSFAAFNGEVPSLGSGAIPIAPVFAPTTIFGWDFFVPESAEPGEEEDLRLLETSIKLARRSDFIEIRGEFYKWLSDISAGGIPPAEARVDMEKRIAEYQRLMSKQNWEKWVRRAIKVLDAFSGRLGLVTEIAGAMAEGFLGTADIVMDERLAPLSATPRVKVAAMFDDARAVYGWRPLIS
jgi:hypothetical protein